MTTSILAAVWIAIALFSPGDPVCSATGRVEGATATAELGAAIDGVIEAVLVEEGDAVAAGEIVARIAAADLAAEVRAAAAEVESLKQKRARLLRGSRDEERAEARARVDSARAAAIRAKESHVRAKDLLDRGSGTLEEEEIARRDAEVADGDLAAATAHRTLVEAAPLPEEVAMADADVLAAEARRERAAALLEKSLVRAPAAGTVLKRFLEPGESVSTQFPRPIVAIADLSRRRVRADVDERDVALVKLGQKVAVSAPALGSATLAGTVERIGAAMGRRQVRSGDPAEKSDRDVLQVMVSIDGADAARLPVGLRVAVEFAED